MGIIAWVVLGLGAGRPARHGHHLRDRHSRAHRPAREVGGCHLHAGSVAGSGRPGRHQPPVRLSRCRRVMGSTVSGRTNAKAARETWDMPVPREQASRTSRTTSWLAAVAAVIRRRNAQDETGCGHDEGGRPCGAEDCAAGSRPCPPGLGDSRGWRFGDDRHRVRSRRRRSRWAGVGQRTLVAQPRRSKMRIRAAEISTWPGSTRAVRRRDRNGACCASSRRTKSGQEATGSWRGRGGG
jgi:hypothetical protein